MPTFIDTRLCYDGTVRTFPGDVVARKDHGEVVPVLLELLPDEVLDDLAHLLEELGPGRDAVAVKDGGPLGQLLVLHVLRGPEPPGSLLVELGAGGDPVDRHVQADLGLDDPDDAVQIMHDPEHHVLLGQDVAHVHGGRMRTPVDDPVEIQVQVVHLGEERLVRDDLVDLGVSLGDPSVKLAQGGRMKYNGREGKREIQQQVSRHSPLRQRGAEASRRAAETVPSRLRTLGTPMMPSLLNRNKCRNNYNNQDDLLVLTSQEEATRRFCGDCRLLLACCWPNGQRSVPYGRRQTKKLSGRWSFIGHHDITNDLNDSSPTDDFGYRCDIRKWIGS